MTYRQPILTTLKTSACALSLCLTIGVMSSSAAYADTFTWTDENGIVNYSERMPRGVPANRVTRVADNALGPSSQPTEPLVYTPSASTSARPSTPSGDRQEGLSEDQQQMLTELQSAEADRQAMVAQVRKDNCERSRRVLQNLQSVGRVRVVAEDGTRSVLPEDERTRRIAEAQRGVAANC